MRPTDRTGQFEGVDVLVATPAKANSTLIEFPGTRAKLPEWRKELSERVREVQARKAREAELEAESDPQPLFSLALEPSPSLGLVPPPEVNPIVAKALERIENARRTVMISRSSGATALAVARAVEEPVMATPAPMIAPIRPVAVQHPVIEPQIEEELADAEIVTTIAPLTIEPVIEETPVARVRVEEQPVLFSEIETAAIAIPVALPDALVASASIETAVTPIELAETSTTIRLRRHDEPLLEETESPLTVRAAAGVLDLMLVIFITSPFAAVIELSGGDWSDPRVWGALAAIAGIVLVLYQASAVALSGRTWGMSLLSLRVADEAFGLYPTFFQSLLRAFVYLLSLLHGGIPLLAALFNEDGLALHDRASHTVVVRHE
jgi:uncharacterized RDD family membrane protein YckC